MTLFTVMWKENQSITDCDISLREWAPIAIV